MTDSRWLTLGLALIFSSCLALPLAGGSLGGAVACLSVNAFAAGILFRGMVDARRRARERERADALFDRSVADLVRVYRPDVEFDEEWGG